MTREKEIFKSNGEIDISLGIFAKKNSLSLEVQRNQDLSYLLIRDCKNASMHKERTEILIKKDH